MVWTYWVALICWENVGSGEHPWAAMWMSADPLAPSANSCLGLRRGQRRTRVMPVRLGGVQPSRRTGVGTVHVHAGARPSHDHVGRVLDVQPRPGAPLFPRVQVAVVAVPPPEPDVAPDMPVMPAMAVLLDSWAATG